MKLAMNTLPWTDDLADPAHAPVLEMLAAAGYDGIEVPIFALESKPYEDLSSRLAGLGLVPLALTAPGPGTNPISADPAERRRARERNLRSLECAAAVGSGILAGPTHAAPTVFTEQAPTQQEREWAIEALRDLAEAADGLGIDLAIESLNHFEHYLTTNAEQTSSLCRAVDHPRCKMLYDTFHAHIEEKDIAAAIAGAFDTIGYVHLSESDRSIPGTAQVDWRTTFRTLSSHGYAGWFTIEAFGHTHPEITRQMRTWRPRFDSAEELARRGASYVRAAWLAAGGD